MRCSPPATTSRKPPRPDPLRPGAAPPAPGLFLDHSKNQCRAFPLSRPPRGIGGDHLSSPHLRKVAGHALDLSRQQAARSRDRQDQLHHAGGRLHRAAQDPRAVEQSSLDRGQRRRLHDPGDAQRAALPLHDRRDDRLGRAGWSTTDGGTTADGGTVVWTEHTPSLRSATNIPSAPTPATRACRRRRCSRRPRR
jgi:hypothetical protein